MNRLLTAQTVNSNSPNCWGLAFDYDVWGNLTKQDVVGSNQCYASGFSIGVDGNNHVMGFTYDQAGNVTYDGHNSYAWNGEGELKTAAGVTYSYDGEGQRVQKSNGKLYWYGQGGEVLDESDGSGNITDEYVYPDGSGFRRRAWTPAERLNFGARFCGSVFGRFISPDWSAKVEPVPYAKLDNPQSLNLWAYVGNNPESLFDPDGHQHPNAAVSTKEVRTGECSFNTCSWTKKTVAAQEKAQQQKRGIVQRAKDFVVQKAKHFVVTHPKTAKAAIITLQVVTVASAFLDDGASAAALPEEEGLEAGAEALETEKAVSADTQLTSAEKNTLEGSQENLESIEKAQDTYRKAGNADRI